MSGDRSRLLKVGEHVYWEGRKAVSIGVGLDAYSHLAVKLRRLSALGIRSGADLHPLLRAGRADRAALPPHRGREAMTALLAVNHLRKHFDGLAALKDVSFELQAGEITGILGPNGAGKTTMFNLLTGFIGADGGTVEFDGHSLLGLGPHRIVNFGLARTFQ
jgi:ABC-type glutathione transport system ATPase component